MDDRIEGFAALDDLFPLLHRLDKLLAHAVAAAEAAYGSDAATDPYRGLHITLQEVEQLLVREPGASPLQLQTENPKQPLPNPAPEGSRLALLQQTFNLSNFDLDILAIALAPELDRRYERLYAYLQDDVRCKQPSVDLALNLLCATAADKLQQRTRFSPDAPLIRHQLLHLIADSNQPKPSLLAQNLQLDAQVVRFLLGETGLDSRLTPFCQLVNPAVTRNPVSPRNPVSDQLETRNRVSPRNPVSDHKALSILCLESRQTQHPLRFYFQGADRTGKRRTAQDIAAEIQTPFLTADLAQIVAAKADFQATIRLIFREAWFQNALLYLDNLETLQSEEHAIYYQHLLTAIAEHKGITILAGTSSWIPGGAGALGIVTVPFTLPNFNQRRQYWQECLTQTGISIPDSELDALAERFRLTPDQIADAAATAGNTARWKAAAEDPVNTDTEENFPIPNPKSTIPNPKLPILFAAARAQSGHDLAALARKIEPKYTWEDIVLPADPQTQLTEICHQAKHRHLVHEDWGFDRKLSLGKGQNVLFSGPPGTGKTMAAEVIAGELQLDLYKIDLSQVVSKYIGETEKNLNRIFTAAAASNAILFFDEADSLFGKRTEVKDAHDRYANIEVGYLLQKMEEYEGVAILTTNARSNMDDAFVRRLRFIVEFPFPKEKDRRRIWEKIWPDATPRSPDIDLDFLSRRFEISGANIRNIALAAAFLAAEDGGSVSMNHLLRAVRREYQKMGKILTEADFAPP
ncbi:ATP-binding protein [Kamptonema formosum]|uniref:ATP-binding protein n=1 Tax=Kamptonema formosum TaxID=331992 RepID=UPI00034548CA|nr:ATP-binding protein [Oscillatoria sp. PCC 10802]